MRTSSALLGVPLLALLLLAFSASPAQGRVLREASGAPEVPFLLRALRDWLPVIGSPVHSSPSDEAPRILIARVDAPGAATRNMSYEDAGILPSYYPNTDCEPECTGDLVCVFRRKAGKKLCRCPRGSRRESPGSDECVDVNGDAITTPVDTPKNADTKIETKTDTKTDSKTGTNTDTQEAPAQTGGGEPCNQQCEMNRRLLKLVNAFRAENGLPPHCLNNKLIQAAKFHTEDTERNNIFSHQGSDGSRYYTDNGIEGRVPRAGFELMGNCPGNKDCDAENFGSGLVNEEIAFKMWRDHKDKAGEYTHRANLLTNAKFMGAYTKNNYYTQDFGYNDNEQCNN